MPSTPRTIRSRPRRSSSRRSSASSTSAYSARSEGSCETLGPDERILGRERLSSQLAVAGERAEDRGLAGLPVQPVEAEQIREELGDPAGELVELSERVVAEREQDVDTQARSAQKLGQRGAQRS